MDFRGFRLFWSLILSPKWVPGDQPKMAETKKILQIVYSYKMAPETSKLEVDPLVNVKKKKM